MSQPLEVQTRLRPPKIAAFPPHPGPRPGAAGAEGQRPTPRSGSSVPVPVFVPTALRWQVHGFERLFLKIVKLSSTPAPILAHSLGFPGEFASLLHRRPGLADGSGCENKTKKTLPLFKAPLSHSGGKEKIEKMPLSQHSENTQVSQPCCYHHLGTQAELRSRVNIWGKTDERIQEAGCALHLQPCDLRASVSTSNRDMWPP